MLAVTKFKSKSDTLIRVNMTLIRLKRLHTASLRDLNLVTASISPSIQDVRELHALSPLRGGQYALAIIKPHCRLMWLIKFLDPSSYSRME